MTVIHIYFQLSDAYVLEHFNETGIKVGTAGFINLEAADLSRSQRERLFGKKIDVTKFDRCNLRVVQESVPDLLDPEQFHAVFQREEDEYDRLWVKASEMVDAAVARGEANLYSFSGWKQYQLTPEQTAGLKANADLDAVQKADRTRQEEENDRLKGEQKLAAQAERAAWVETNGSEQLKLAFKHGYSHQRLYVNQRALVEYPGFYVDFDDKVTVDRRSGPSLAALQQLETLNELHPEADIEIYWMTGDGKECDWDDESFKAQEIILVTDYLGKYYLVKELGDPQAS